MRKKSSEIEFPATLTNADLTSLKQPGSEPDAPPRGSALHIETALTYARKIKHTEQIETAWMYVDTVIEQLEEVSAKIKKQWQAAP
jgi:hypothetical protein